MSDQAAALNSLRLSVDSERSNTSSPPVHNVNGHNNLKANSNGIEDGDVVSRLEKELERTREEKEQLATQYRNLLAKLTTMRTTLGTKLKQDAVRLHFSMIRDFQANYICVGRTGPTRAAASTAFRTK